MALDVQNASAPNTIRAARLGQIHSLRAANASQGATATKSFAFSGTYNLYPADASQGVALTRRARPIGSWTVGIDAVDLDSTNALLQISQTYALTIVAASQGFTSYQSVLAEWPEMGFTADTVGFGGFVYNLNVTSGANQLSDDNGDPLIDDNNEILVDDNIISLVFGHVADKITEIGTSQETALVYSADMAHLGPGFFTADAVQLTQAYDLGVSEATCGFASTELDPLFVLQNGFTPDFRIYRVLPEIRALAA